MKTLEQILAECKGEEDFKPHMMYDPKTGKGVKANTYADHVKYDKMGYTHEKPELKENYRTLARKGMGTETKKDARVGLELDFYETERGDKVFGKIIKVTGTGYTVQAMERGNNKKYTFKFHDRMKAKKLLQNESIQEEVISEVTDVEINLMKQLSKDAEKLKKNYALIVKAGDKELRDRKYNKEYKTILDMQQAVLSLIGKLQTKKIIDDSKSRKESLEEKLSKTDLKFMSMMYDKKGKLTDVGKAVMNYKPGDNIRKIVQNLNNKKEAVSPAQQAAIAISKKEKGEKPIKESRARRDAMRGMSADPDFQDKDSKDVRATDDDRKAASKNILMQIRKATDLPKGGDLEFPSGKKGKISQADAKKVDRLFNMLKKPQDKAKFQKVISKDLNSIKGLLKRLGR